MDARQGPLENLALSLLRDVIREDTDTTSEELTHSSRFTFATALQSKDESSVFGHADVSEVALPRSGS